MEAPDILGGGLSLGQDFRGGETGLNFKEGAGAGQAEKEKAVDSRPMLFPGHRALFGKQVSGCICRGGAVRVEGLQVCVGTVRVCVRLTLCPSLCLSVRPLCSQQVQNCPLKAPLYLRLLCKEA